MSFYTVAIICLSAFLVLSVWTKDIVQILAELLFAPQFGLRLNIISLFGLRLERQQDGTWTRSFKQFTPMMQHNLITLRKEDGTCAEAHELAFSIVRFLILAAVSFLVLHLCDLSIRTVIWGVPGYSEYFLAAYALGLCWHTIVNLGIMIYVFGFSMKKLGGYVQSLIKRLRAGESFASMGLRPLEELPYKNPLKIEKLMYLSLYLSMLLEQERTEELAAPTRQLAGCITPTEYLVQETWAYYWMIFYYSRYELSPRIARAYLDRVSPSIYQDKDANAKRVLAYYYFGSENDPAKARRYLDEAWAAVEHFSTSAERDLERRLLQELEYYLQKNHV